MLTDEEVAKADAEYAALPGTEPDGFSSERLDKVPDKQAWVHEKMAEWHKEGMRYVRVTVEEDHNIIWLEVWKETPRKEAPFKGHYTYASPETVE